MSAPTESMDALSGAGLVPVFLLIIIALLTASVKWKFYGNTPLQLNSRTKAARQ